MASFSDLQTRRLGTVRRKSSAQNLLSTFQSSATAVVSSLPLVPTVSNASGVSSTLATSSSSSSTPVVAVRDVDTITSQSEIISGFAAVAIGSPQLCSGTSAEYLRDLIQKRILTLTYIRSVHEGHTHWFHTLAISRADLDREFSNSSPDIRKRANRFAVLGMSLANLLDINHPQDLLRGLISMINEFDQNKDDGDKSKIRPSKRLFKPKITKRAGTSSFTEFAGALTDSTSDTSYLVAAHVAFPMDYHETLISLVDVISEVYNKIMKMLGPSPITQSSQHMMGPLGLVSPHPGVSYILDPCLDCSSNNNLWNIANPSGMSIMYGGLVGGLNAWSASLEEMVLKFDSKIKKITTSLLKELDILARNGIKNELAALDPLLGSIGPGGKTINDEAFG